jgi:hypothetical protein
MKISIITLAVIVIPALAMADSKWVGKGQEFSPNGSLLGSYTSEVVNTDKAANVMERTTTITTADGKQKVISQTLTMNETGWSVDSNLGKGGGACYGSDICENYIVGANGLSYATTIISDSANSQRYLTIILQNGEAVKVLRENTKRVN